MDAFQGQSLVAKALLSPTLIGFASWIARRWGPEVGGWFAGLPLTSGPIVLILALDRGPEFATEACMGTMQAIGSLAVFALAYAWSATRLGWRASSMIACSIYTLSLWPLQWMPSALAPAFLSVCLILGTSLTCMPPTTTVRTPAVYSRWDIPLRMILAAILTISLTLAAGKLGPRLAGLLTPFPIAATILAAFTHHSNGPDAAIRLLRSLLSGLSSFAVFFLTAGTLLSISVPAAFTAAVCAALISHAIIWLLLKPKEFTQ